MIKHILLAGGMMMAAPAMAQVAPADQNNPTAPARAAPGASDPSAMSAQPTAPSAPDQSAQAAPAPADPSQAAPAQAAQAQPAGSGESAVAQVVDQGWSTYDKNGDGKLSEAEFAAWMVDLKKQSDPATKAASPATKQYVASAFAMADKDKSRTVSRHELEAFLGQGQG